MKFKIIRGITEDKLTDTLPTEYKGFVRTPSKSTTPCTVILFRHDRRDVIHSRETAKALRYLGDVEEKVYAVSGQFTIESEALLREKNIEMICIGGSFWTDERHTEISVLVGKRSG